MGVGSQPLRGVLAWIPFGAGQPDGLGCVCGCNAVTVTYAASQYPFWLAPKSITVVLVCCASHSQGVPGHPLLPGKTCVMCYDGLQSACLDRCWLVVDVLVLRGGFSVTLEQVTQHSNDAVLDR